ncbi:MAG: hypothetical protein JO345_15105 [Streptosporangiaceae bacterium]|nr:hypothetical protein [Streptosporangiaceae bacterium]
MPMAPSVPSAGGQLRVHIRMNLLRREALCVRPAGARIVIGRSGLYQQLA